MSASPAGRGAGTATSPDGTLSVASPTGESSGSSSRARDSSRTGDTSLFSQDKPSDVELGNLDPKKYLNYRSSDVPSTDETVVSSTVPNHQEGNIQKIDWLGPDEYVHELSSH